MEEIWKDKKKFGEIMNQSTIPYKDFMFDDAVLKVRCWKALVEEWDVIQKYLTKKYSSHPKDLKLNI